MGMYTRLNISCNIKATKEYHLTVLDYMIGRTSQRPNAYIQAHRYEPLFKTPRWEWMLNSRSYCFEHESISYLNYDEIGKYYVFGCDCDLKNYDNEIECFLKWLAPALDSEGLVYAGYYHYEEDEPQFILFDHRKVRIGCKEL